MNITPEASCVTKQHPARIPILWKSFKRDHMHSEPHNHDPISGLTVVFADAGASLLVVFNDMRLLRKKF